MKHLLLALLIAVPAAAEEGGRSCLFDTSCPDAPPSAVAVLAKESAPRADLLKGATKGVEEGAMLGFAAVLTPAVSLMSEGFDRGMNREDGGDFYMAAGIAVGVLLYVPALAVGFLGGLFGAPAGAVAEGVSPGSTKSWDAERWLFD